MSDSQVLRPPPQLSPQASATVGPFTSLYVVRSPRDSVSFEWTVPSDPHTSSHIRDLEGNTLYTIKSPSTRKTVIADDYGDVVAKIKFPAYSKPTVRFNRDVTMRIKDWIQFSRESQ